MQGTSLNEVFGNFTSSTNTSFEDPLMSMFFESTRISRQRDISGSTLFELTQENILQSLSEQPPPIDTKVLQLRITIDDYKTLKNDHKFLMDEIEHIEKNIGYLETTHQRAITATNEYIKALLTNGILSKDEFFALQEKEEELSALQRNAKQKCMNEYKKTAKELSSKLRTIQTNMAAYSDFIKQGTKEMVGENVKPTSCSICFENDITHCFVPCGHTFCEGCIKKSSADKCMTCRTPVQKSIKIFIGA